MNTELHAILELLSMLLLEPRTGVLVAALVAAAWADVKSRRIPNELVFGGMAVALAYGAIAPAGNLPGALAGLAVGLALLLPFHLLRAMGAGDVKLMAMAGAFLGFPDALFAVLATFLAGGAMAVAVALRNGSLRRMLANLSLMVLGAAGGGGMRPTTADAKSSAGSLPYGVAIAGGTIGFIVLRQLGFLG